METEIKKLAQFISIWGWHLSAIIFLVSSLLSISISIKFINSILFAAFLVGFSICEFQAYKRKSEFYGAENEVIVKDE